MHCFVTDFTLAQTCDSVCVRTATQRALLLKLLKALNHTILISLISCMSYTTSVTMQVPNDPMYDLFTYIWVILGVNVGKCTIHWVSGVYFRLSFSEIWAWQPAGYWSFQRSQPNSQGTHLEAQTRNATEVDVVSEACWARFVGFCAWGSSKDWFGGYEFIKKPCKV